MGVASDFAAFPSAKDDIRRGNGGCNLHRRRNGRAGYGCCGCGGGGNGRRGQLFRFACGNPFGGI